MTGRSSSEFPHDRSRTIPRSRVALLVALVIVATALPVLGPTVIAGAGDKEVERAPLFAEPGTPPGPLSDEAREPVLALPDENGVRDPDEVPIALADAASPADALKDLDPLREDGSSNVDVFAVGPYNADHVAAVYTEDVNYQAADGQWKDLPELAPDDDGWSATVQEVFVRFPSVLSAATPVQISFPGGGLSTAPQGVDAKGELANGTVTYVDAFADVDLLYSLDLGGYLEQIVLKTPKASAAITYDVFAPGLVLRPESDGSISVRSGDQIVATMPAPVATDASDKIASSAGSYGLKDSGDGGFELSLRIDAEFLAGATYPVTIDPTTVGGIYANPNDTYVDSADSSDHSALASLLVTEGGPTRYSFIKFDVSSLQQADRIVYDAAMALRRNGASGGADVDAHRVTADWPAPMTWANQPPVGELIDTDTSPCCSGGWLFFHLQELFQHVIQTNAEEPWVNHGVRLSTSGTSSYSYISANGGVSQPQLSVTYNDLPPAPTLAHPATGTILEHDSPTLKVDGGTSWPTDPNGDEVFVQFQISDSPTDFSTGHIAWESPWQDERAYVVPSGILVDGQTYYWRARSWDVCTQPDLMCSLTDGAGEQHDQFFSASRSITIALRHFGDDDRWAMWSHEVGNGMTLQANESNGNVFLDVPLDTLSTAIGDLAIGLSYNSQQNADYGLSPGWDLSIGPGPSARDLPVALEKMSPFPDAGVKIRLGGGRIVYFPHREKGTFSSVGAGAGRVKQNVDGPTPADRTFTYTTSDGATYTFANNGKLIEANPVFAQPAGGTNSIDYTVVGGNITQVSDPLGRHVDLGWTGGKLTTITAWATLSEQNVWTIAYNPINGRLNTISVQVTNDSVVPPATVTESVDFSYFTGTGFEAGLLREIDNGVIYANARTGWTLTYVQDANQNARVSSITAPPFGAPTAPTPWTFEYSGTLWGTTQATACVTDPLGTPAPLCDGAHMTKVDFNTAGLPVRIAGPADQTGYFPVHTTIWDTNNNLICQRSPAANAVAEISNPNPCLADSGSTRYTYQTDPPYQMLTRTPPSPNSITETYTYDSDTAGAQWNGLWLEKYENATLYGVPKDETVWSNFDANWGTGAPPGLSSVDNFSLRFTGYLNITWSTAKKVAFRLTTADEGATLIVGNAVLLDCVGTTQPAGSYNCGMNTDVKKKLWPGLKPITIEYSDPGGAAAFKLEWDQGTGSWQTLPAFKVQTNLGLLTSSVVGPASGGTNIYQTTYAFPDDDAKTRRLPASITVKDIASSVTRQTAYTYNAYGQVNTVTTAAGTGVAATTTNTYTNNATTSCLTQVIDPTGAETDFVCNQAGDVEQVTQVVRAVAGTNQSTLQNRTTTTAYDSLGRVSGVTTPSGGSTVTTYDLAGRPTQIDQYLGTGAAHDAHAYATLVYDDAGRLTDETLPLVPNPAVPGTFVNPTIHRVYDWLDDETSMTDPRGKVWQTVYDAFRRPIQTTSPSGLIAATEYRLWSTGVGYDQKTTTWTPPGNPTGVATVTKLNVVGWTTSEQMGTIPATTYAYDSRGNLTQITDPATIKTSFSYNGFSQQTQRIDFYLSSKAVTTTFSYDAAGRLQTENGPRTDVDDSVTYGYDFASRLTTVTQNGLMLPGTGSTPVTTSYVYDDAAERVQVTQPMSSSQSLVRNWSFDPTNRTFTYADARGTTTSTTNLVGWTEQVADPRGTTLSFEYDNLGRRSRRYASGGTDDQTFTYDLASNLLAAKVVASGTTITADYDDDARVSHVYQASWPTPTTTYAYHPTTGRLASVVDPAGTTSFAYNANGQLSDLTDPFSATHTIYSYDSYGRLYRRSDGGSKCASLTFESGSGRPDVLTVRKTTACTSGTVLATFDLGYDAASNVSSRAETITGNSYGGTYTYTYDAANRLATATGPAAFGSRTYAYDGAGNRTSVQVGAGTPVTTTYDGAGLPLSSSDGTTYTHDAVGDLTVIDRPGGTANDWRSTFNSWNQLTKAEHTAGSSDVTYTLDALDRVLSRTAGGSTSSYSYQGVGEILAKAVTGATTTLYASTPGGPLAQKLGSTTRYYIRDQHGDLTGWTDTTGTLKGTALYDPWGQLLSGTGEMATVPAQGAFRFQGDLADASTGQVDMLTRLYEPSLGRFSSRDALFGEPTDPFTLNQFVYGGASPVTFSDPTGLVPVCGEGCTGQEEAALIQEYAASFTQTGASQSPPAVSLVVLTAGVGINASSVAPGYRFRIPVEHAEKDESGTLVTPCSGTDLAYDARTQRFRGSVGGICQVSFATSRQLLPTQAGACVASLEGEMLCAGSAGLLTSRDEGQDFIGGTFGVPPEEIEHVGGLPPSFCAEHRVLCAAARIIAVTLVLTMVGCAATGCDPQEVELPDPDGGG